MVGSSTIHVDAGQLPSFSVLNLPEIDSEMKE
jgi:hypothetical protein